MWSEPRTTRLRTPANARYRRIRVLRLVALVAATAVLVVTGIAWYGYQDVVAGLRRSGPLPGLAAPGSGPDQNILVIGLDSRLDENGDPLPPDVYEALDTGDASVGGYNANVLMLVHLPGNGDRATAMSVPRDDYVDLAGSPDGIAKGKIKQAYGLAFDQRHRALVGQGVTDKTTLEQSSRDAGRNAEILTVEQFLGVRIDRFVEVTMVAFYEIAKVVAPITVCVNEDTRDTYSGADFHQGYQQIDAAQAVAFVRQRRDTAHPQLNFTDLDRERRQQAFIASLAYQLKQAGTLTNPATVSGLIDVARQNTAIDPGLDPLSLLDQVASIGSGNITFATLPIDHFGRSPRGEDVNIVDVQAVRAAVAHLLAPAAAPPSDAAPPPTLVVDVLNAGARPGVAAIVSHDLAALGYAPGATGNTGHSASTVAYNPADRDAAQALAHAVGIASSTPDASLPAGHARVLLGAGYQPPAATTTTSAPSTEPQPATPATDQLGGGGIPCVK